MWKWEGDLEPTISFRQMRMYIEEIISRNNSFWVTDFEYLDLSRFQEEGEI